MARRPAQTPDLLPGDGVLTGPPMATRREFAAAAAATAAAAALGAKATETALAQEDGEGTGSASADGDEGAASSSADGDAASATQTEVDQVTNALGFEDLTQTQTYTPWATFELPLGSMVRADCAGRLAILKTNDVARPLTLIQVLDVTSGEVTTVLEQAVSGDDYSPSECRVTDSIIVWVEIDNATDAWALYAAPFTGGALDPSSSSICELAEGDADWLPPQPAVYESTVVWQLMPDPSGPYVTQSSQAFRWRLGEGEATLIWTSPGRFGCAPSISAGVLTIAPRVNASSGVYYGVTSVDLASGEQLDQYVLPVSVSPFMATTLGGKLAFSIEANYGYGGTFGSMGYLVGRGAGDEPFLSLPLEPSAQVCRVAGCYIMRSQLSYYVIDPEKKTLARIYAANNCNDFGDYPASSGDVTLFVTFATIKDVESNMPKNVLVRIYTLR